jgi:hypothetical protein
MGVSIEVSKMAMGTCYWEQNLSDVTVVTLSEATCHFLLKVVLVNIV